MKIESDKDRRKKQQNRILRTKKQLGHLDRVSREIKKLQMELMKNNDCSPAGFENRLLWAIRGVDPRKSVCTKHGVKIMENIYGEYVCPDCMDDYIHDDSPLSDELWFDPSDEPKVTLQEIKYC